MPCLRTQIVSYNKTQKDVYALPRMLGGDEDEQEVSPKFTLILCTLSVLATCKH